MRENLLCLKSLSSRTLVNSRACLTSCESSQSHNLCLRVEHGISHVVILRVVLCCVVLCCVVFELELFCVVCVVFELELCCVVLYCEVLYCIVWCCIVLYCIVLYCIILYCIVLCGVVLYCVVLRGVVLCSVVIELQVRREKKTGERKREAEQTNKQTNLFAGESIVALIIVPLPSAAGFSLAFHDAPLYEATPRICTETDHTAVRRNTNLTGNRGQRGRQRLQ